MSKNSLKKLAALSLLGIFALTGCDAEEIYSKPSGYSDSVVTIAGEDGYKDMEAIYDAWRNGSLASDTLDEMLYQYSISAFGRYDTTLSEVVAEINNSGDSTKTKTHEFISSHKAYHVFKEDGTTHDFEKECSVVLGKYAAIEKRVATKMYELIKSGAYSKDSLFSEAKLLRSLRSDYEDVQDPTTADAAKLHENIEILPSVEPEDVFDHYLTKEFYTGYIVKKIIPTIYSQLLNEQYLFNEATGTVGRSRARKINVFSITARSGLENSKAADYLMNYLFEVLTAPSNSDIFTTHPTWASADKLNLFKDFSNAWIGTVDEIAHKNTVLEEILAKQTGEEKVFERISVTDEDDNELDAYYSSTDRGIWMKDFEKIDIDPELTDKTVESIYTGNGKYTAEHGKLLKERETRLKDYTSTGWYIESEGVQNLPESISKRLFNSAVADAKKEETTTDAKGDEYHAKYDRYQNGVYSAEHDYGNYLAYINGSYYLKSTGLVPGADAQDIFFKEGNTFYVVQVLEAVNTTKMGKTSLSYSNLGRSEADIQDMTNEIARLIAEGSTYKSLAKEHWIKEMGVKFHDTVIYDYFVSTYPDIFGEDND